MGIMSCELHEESRLSNLLKPQQIIDGSDEWEPCDDKSVVVSFLMTS